MDAIKEQGKELSTTQVIMLSFLAAILVGTFLLMLPICSSDGIYTPFLTAFFTATTSVCVTGLVVVDTFAYWSTVGHVVILFLIQIGGLGVVTLSTYILMLLGQKIGLKQRILLEDALNLDTMSGLIKFIKKVFGGTLCIEGVGALFYMFAFVPEMGVKGIWVSVFHAVSAFCNAGIDILGPVSLINYVGNPIVNFTTMALIIMGGIGFIVWWDIIKVLKEYRTGEIHRRYIWHKLRLHSKIVLYTTMGLILVGFAVILLLEWNNPETLGNLSIPVKLQAALFQSVTLRTAGFATISQKGLYNSTAFICLLFMFIGGSPVGTAGGIKTTTAATLFVAVWSTIKGRDYTSVFRRKLNPAIVRKALSVALISMLAALIALILMLTFCNGDFMDLTYEVFSAIGTVGLTRNVTAGLNTVGRIIIIICMYLGRTGPISLVIALNNISHKNKGAIEFPEENITVG
ncbi:MAG: potassium transporter KtrB [Lachnospiraceae bacterium]|nr:potassium transporter KtrB [Lachnospiraceae bacterium]